MLSKDREELINFDPKDIDFIKEWSCPNHLDNEKIKRRVLAKYLSDEKMIEITKLVNSGHGIPEIAILLNIPITEVCAAMQKFVDDFRPFMK